MLLANPDRPGRAVRLAYCMNFAEATNLDGVLDGLRGTALPLRERLGSGRAFGVGLWIPGALALELAAEGTEAELDRLLEFLDAHDLETFTFNAFPWGGFHEAGGKERVFRPTWKAPERLAYTLAVARIAAAAWAVREERPAHVSISTHAGMHASTVSGPADLDACADNFALCALHLAQLEDETSCRVVLSLEPEPRSTANDTRELPALFERIRARAVEVLARGFPSVRGTAEDLLERYLGTCLDACHAAVEFEEPGEAFARAPASGIPLGKLQLSNALRLSCPDEDAEGRARLLAMDEPVFLHQLTARRGAELLRAADLPEVRGDAPAWRGADEWRCHFHVPVDLAELDPPDSKLATTREDATALLEAVLGRPERWGSPELHIEIETYTWSVLPPAARGAGSILDGQERECRHVLARLARAGWRPA